ncbi:topoisomerase I binding, arginine/serine-rich a [Trachinotus anak]|uniref:topoisomerase I binding, arginine/serine-rich a n=1 Tax=Trachinotus anak TaxID=443729 RepID=UPI0039F1A203
MSAIKIALQQSQKSGRRKTSEASSAEVSPDSKCPICLDIFNNISYLDLCLHKFCFRCIHEWSKNKAECPLCKQPFNSIYHSIKSEQDFKKYDLQPINNGSFGTFGGVRFRYRTTLTGVHRQMHGRTSPPPDNGVMFEASTNTHQQLQDRYIRRMMMRLAAKRRAASEGRAVNSVREQEMINFRRELYRQGVRVRTVRDGGRSRDTSAEFYRRNPACLHRLIPWLKRELIVLYGSHGSLVNIVQHIIMSRLTRFDMEDGAIQEELRPFIQGRTEHFLHEFISFAKSPFNMEAYDQHAVYDCPAPSSNEDSSSNSSVIAISEDEEHYVELDPSRDSMSNLSQSMWDDETPGPSYSTTAEQSRAERLSVINSDSDSSLEEESQEFGASPQQMSPHNQTNMTQGEVNNEECLSDSDDCVIVGFVKPTAERTPELVQLSSNSDESGSEDTKEVPLLPQHIRFPSLSPPASQSSDPSGAGRSENVETDQYYQSDFKERCSSTTSGRHKTSSKSDRKETDRGFDGNERSREKYWSKDRDHRRRRRSRSREHRHSSRSPPISHSNVSALSRERDYSNFSSRDLFSKCDSSYKRRDSYQSYQSYRRYSQERNDSGTHYTERRSYYYSSRKYSDRHSHSRSRSHSRDSRRRDRRCSRSLSSSRSPSAKRRPHHDKPGGKRKYKTRHLEEPSKNTLSKSYHDGDSATLLTKHKKKSKEKHRKKSKERSRKTSRSLSVELINEENSNEQSKRHHKKKKKHKKKSKRHKSNERTEKHSPTVITIDSDSDSFANDSVTQASSTNKDNPIDSTTDETVDAAILPTLM